MWLLLAAAAGLLLMTKSGIGGEGNPLFTGSGGRAINAEPSQAIQTSIVSICRAYTIPPAFGLAVAAHESRFNPNAGLNTLGSSNLRAGTIPERSIGLMQINVNPNTPTGRRRIAQIKDIIGGGATDSAVVDWLKDAENNLGYWCANIARPLADRAGQNYTGRAKWLAVRVGLYASTLSPTGAQGMEYQRIFAPTFDKWIARYPLSGE